jgi:HlyD family secretion protein
VVATSNPDLKLLPGMTASISFEVDALKDVLKIPAAALRFIPEHLSHVREEDRKLLDGSMWKSSEELESSGALSVREKTEAQRNKNKRHVWAKDGERLRAVEIETGIMESKYVVMTRGQLKAGDEMVTGVSKK